ncbi:MAG TPA: hypothetical protein VHQ44_08565 [Thermoanaerobaculia bacterium]|nr:hypothetical protein [Thermoanaerobaculia bacterium]
MLASAVVLRRVLVLLCAAVLIQETSLGSLVVGAACLEKCANDTAPGHCSPICAACTCGTHANPVSARVTRLPVPAASKSHAFVEAAPAAGDQHLPDILHVPKRFVA